MLIPDLVALLKTKDPAQEVQFIVVAVDTSIVAMELTDEVADLQKLLKAFKKPKRAAARKAQP